MSGRLFDQRNERVELVAVFLKTSPNQILSPAKQLSQLEVENTVAYCARRARTDRQYLVDMWRPTRQKLHSEQSENAPGHKPAVYGKSGHIVGGNHVQSVVKHGFGFFAVQQRESVHAYRVLRCRGR
jgi:hypothetical protein